MFKSLSIGVLALLLAACGALKARHATPQNPEESIPRPSLPPGTVYRIDENQSELRILVYRAGTLARFGHNHVIVNHSIRGAVSLADAAGESAFWLHVPVAGFVVDDAQARREEGADFAGDIPEDAKAGTLLNMLSTSLLDADEFPVITVNGVAESGAQDGAGALTAAVAISVAGHESRVDVPLTLHIDSRRLSATGSLDLRQSALGLTPFSLMLGALQVQDAMTIKFDIVAVPGGPAAASLQDSRIGVPSGAINTAAGNCRSGSGISPAGEMPMPARLAKVLPTSSTSNRRVERRKCEGSYSPRST